MTGTEISTEDLAALLGVSAVTVTKLHRRKIIPRGSKRGKWDPAACVPAYCEHLREAAAGRRAESGLDLVQERARLARLQADKVSMEIARLDGTLVEAEQVRQRVVGMIAAAKNRLLALPTSLKSRIPTLTVSDIEVIERLITDALMELSNGTHHK